MPVQLIQPSVAAGELDPLMYYRVDLAKWHIGAKTMCNWFVKPQGGASNRAGTAFVGELLDSTKAGRLLPFQFSASQTYALELGDFKMRFITAGGYITETAKTITAATKANPCQLSITSHGYSTGDRIFVTGVVGMTQLNNRFFTVTSTGANTLTIGIDSSAYTTFVSGASAAARLYTLATPWAYTDLPLLKYEQSADTMTLTHKSYASYKLTRSTNTLWALTAITFAPVTQPPTGLAAGSSGTTVKIQVTAINDTTGEESLPCTPVGSTSGTDAWTWNAVTGCSSYNVYKLKGSIYGFAAQVGTNGWTDDSLVPDIQTTPPQARNPFGAGRITAVTVGAGGSAYSSPTVTAVDSTGSGATFSVSLSGGAVTGVSVTNGGQNYSSNTILRISDGGGTGASLQLNFIDDGTDGVHYKIDSVTVLAGGASYHSGAYATVIQPNGSNNGAALSLTIVAGVVTACAVVNAGYGFSPSFPFPYATVTDSAGSGATLTPTVTADGITWPALSLYHDGRQWFMATISKPQTLWGSVAGAFNNMNVSAPTRDSDAIVRTLAGKQVNEIKHGLSLQQMILFTAGAEWKVSAGSNADVITPAQFSARAQSYNGCSDVRPLVINDLALYVPASQKKIRSLQYQWAADTWSGTDLTLLAAHVFDSNLITQMQYARDPDSIVWGIRDDGQALMFTALPEQQLFAMARATTANGLFEDVCCVQEGNETAVYFIVKRVINGATKRYVERLASRVFATIATAWFLDCAVEQGTGFNTDVTVTAKVQAGSYLAGAAVLLGFVNTTLPSTVIGKTMILRHGSDTVSVRITTTGTGVLVTDCPASLQNVATSDFAIPLVNGLWHLIGETVYALIDGVPVGPFTVNSSGQIVLDTPVFSACIAGKLIPDADIETIGADQTDQAGTVQGRKKKVNHVTLGLKNSANQGLYVGPSGGQTTTQYQIKPKDLVNPLAAAPSTAPSLVTDLMHSVMPPGWDWYGRIKISATLPLPYTITGIMYDITAGS